MIKTFCCKKLLIHVRKRVILEILKVKGLNLSSLGYPWFVQASSVTLQISFTAQEHNQTVIHQSLRKTSSFDFKVNILKCRLFSLNLNNFFVQSTVHIYQKKPLSQGSLTFTNYYYFFINWWYKKKASKMLQPITIQHKAKHIFFFYKCSTDNTSRSSHYALQDKSLFTNK